MCPVVDKQGNSPLHLAASSLLDDTLPTLFKWLKENGHVDGESCLALLAANREGYNVFHLALKDSGCSAKAQAMSIALMDLLGQQAQLNVMKGKVAIRSTPLMLAIQGHQDLLVKKILDGGANVNEGSYDGKTPLSILLEGITNQTFEIDAGIFDHLISAGAASGKEVRG